jgi:hypothetical protein
VTYDERIQRAKRAEQLLTDEVFIEAIADAEERIIADWKASQDSAGREMCWMKLQALEAVQGQLRATVDDGSVLLARVAKEERK